MGNSTSSPASPRPSPSPSRSHPPPRPAPPRRKSLELPDLAGLAFSPVRPIPLPAPRPPAMLAEIEHAHSRHHTRTHPIHHRAYYAPPAALVTRPADPPRPHRRHERQQPPPPSQPPHQRASPSPRPKPRESPAESYIVSSVPTGLPSDQSQASTSTSSAASPLSTSAPTLFAAPERTVQTRITWRGIAKKVSVSRTIETAWSEPVRMSAESPASSASPPMFSVTLDLPPGNHRLRFLVDDAWRRSDDLPTAVDDDGNLVNHLEVPSLSASASSESCTWDASSYAPKPTPRPWTSAIPARLVRAQQMEESYLAARASASGLSKPAPPPIPQPPMLPRHLEKVILNRPSGMPGDDNSVLSVPNHVVLNHLGTSAIKNGVLAVGTTTRYHRKYISTIFYKPVLA
ncbi:carbohydrate-binding module family 48 protein [Botryobasidium botryosum FD-172 SS1]|uniref:Carbohydrate-binding module family 48 protein n=1 Tax=Botryobasidium botryosum (strain FD-172 SS1) TaxID=930990 RepID=A0A067M7D6_BOTB1|nr:carbohydrate-binding module family 48 protein [Botryobasidium botryosum FD-172 SS1]